MLKLLPQEMGLMLRNMIMIKKGEHSMDFGEDLTAIKCGQRCARYSWNCSQSDMLSDDWYIISDEF